VSAFLAGCAQPRRFRSTIRMEQIGEKGRLGGLVWGSRVGYPTGVTVSASTLEARNLSRTRYARSGGGYLRDIRRLSRGLMSRSTQD
jgi:hypothetical protein